MVTADLDILNYPLDKHIKCYEYIHSLKLVCSLQAVQIKISEKLN